MTVHSQELWYSILGLSWSLNVCKLLRQCILSTGRPSYNKTNSVKALNEYLRRRTITLKACQVSAECCDLTGPSSSEHVVVLLVLTRRRICCIPADSKQLSEHQQITVGLMHFSTVLIFRFIV